MIETICALCLCLVIEGKPLTCNRCTDIATKDAVKRMVDGMESETEFMALNCRPKGTPPRMNFNPGMFVPKGEK